MSERKVKLANGDSVLVQQHYHGCYRWTIDGEQFGQVKRDGHQWKAEIRESSTGSLIRYAGIWPTLREALAELVDYRNGERGPWTMRSRHRSAHDDCPDGRCAP